LSGIGELVEGFGEFSVERVFLLGGLLKLFPNCDSVPIKFLKGLFVENELGGQLLVVGLGCGKFLFRQLYLTLGCG
jgi:hypothetical protein